MLIIRDEQLDAFRKAGTERYAEDLGELLQDEFSDLLPATREDRVDLVLRLIDRARGYRITSEADVYKFVVSSLVFGEGLGGLLAAPLAAKTNFDSAGSIKPGTCRWAEA